MTKISIEVCVGPEARVPVYATSGAAGADLHAAIHLTLEPMERKLVPTGLRLAIPAGYEVQIRPRSGLALKKGLGMVNAPGTIDSDYRGEIGIILINFGDEPIEIEAGERIAQMVMCPVVQADFVVVDELGGTERGAGGFGSTGMREV